MKASELAEKSGDAELVLVHPWYGKYHDIVWISESAGIIAKCQHSGKYSAIAPLEQAKNKLLPCDRCYEV